MSTKTTFKRVALVAVASLGFGMLSVVPSSATYTTVTVARSSGAVDASVSVYASGTSALARTYSVYTSNSAVPLTDLTVDPAGNFTTGDPVVLAAGTTTDLAATAATVYLSRSGTNGSEMAAFALSDATATGTLSSLAASVAGTTYLIWEDADADQKWDTGGSEPYAEITVYRTVSTASIASTQLTSSAVGPNGMAGTWRIRYNTANTTDTVNPKARITSVPAGSRILNTNPLNSYFPVNNSAATDLAPANIALVNGSAAYRTAAGTALAQVAANSSKQSDTWFSMWPDVAGSYVVTFFDDRNNDGVVNGNDISTSVTFTVGAAATKVAVANLGGDAPTTATNPGASSEYGALFKITLTDAAGVAAVPNNSESLNVVSSGSGLFTFKNGSAIAATSSVALSAGDFNAAGEAFLNLSNATAETVTVTATGNGSISAVSGSASATFRAAVVSGAVPAVISTQLTGYAGTSTPYTVPVSGSTITWVATGTTTTATVTYYQALLIQDTDQDILGTGPVSGTLVWEKIAANGNADATVPGRASWSITTAATTTTGELYRVVGQTTLNTSATAQVVNGGVPAITSGKITWTPAAIRSALLAANTHTVTLTDQFGNAVAGASVTFSRAGRNPSTVNTVVITDSLGKASYTTTDAAASTATTMTDTITASASYTLVSTTTLSSTATITYASGAAVSTVTLTAPDELSTIPGTVFTNITAAATGATGSSASVKATVKDAAGLPIAGVLVTFAVSGLTGAEVHTNTVSVYTDANGEASSSISSYAAGKATVTATAGSAKDTDSVYFAQASGDTAEVRTIAVAATGGSVKATVKDRYGNVMEGIRVYATRTGTGYFGSGSSSSDALTGKDGTAEFLFTGTGSVTVAFLAGDTGQSAAAADKVGTTAVTAYSAGTASAAQKGLGGSLAPAGINSATVAVEAGNAAADAASAAADAAAEATDAANAATDAANAAAEAADAATAAAQDAADAVAALSTQVSEMVDALKKQITALTNLVIKIQKKVKA
jgi:hypothetical protein